MRLIRGSFPSFYCASLIVMSFSWQRTKTEVLLIATALLCVCCKVLSETGSKFDLARRIAIYQDAEHELSQPGKTDFASSTLGFKLDLIDFFRTKEEEGLRSVVELGIYRGQTAAFLAAIFDSVVAVEGYANNLLNSTHTWEEVKTRFGGGLGDISFVFVDLYAGGVWPVTTGLKRADVVFIDAGHLAREVDSDLRAALLMKPKYIILDDTDCYYPGAMEIPRVVRQYEEMGVLNCSLGIGYAPTITEAVARSHCQIMGQEASICTVNYEGLRLDKLLHEALWKGIFGSEEWLKVALPGSGHVWVLDGVSGDIMGVLECAERTAQLHKRPNVTLPVPSPRDPRTGYRHYPELMCITSDQYAQVGLVPGTKSTNDLLTLTLQAPAMDTKTGLPVVVGQAHLNRRELVWALSLNSMHSSIVAEEIDGGRMFVLLPQTRAVKGIKQVLANPHDFSSQI